MNGESVTSIAKQVRSGTRTAEDVIATAIDRAEASQVELNAFTSIAADRALSRATAIDEAVASGNDPGPLAGVPVGLKDLIDQAGLPNTRGSAGFPALAPLVSAPVVERLEAAGAVIIGRTGLHEFAFGFSSENEWFGSVHNPWDTTLSPGGSSGGSGAAVAAGVVPVAIGTDTGGSVRVPAALCGVAGLKVSYGAVPLEGVFPLAPSLDTVGPLARSIEDLAATFDVMAGTRSSPDEGHAERALSIGVPRSWMRGPIHEIVAAGFDRFLEDLAAAGVSLVPVDELEAPEEDVLLGAAVEISEIHRANFEAGPERYGADVATRLRSSLEVPEGTLEAAQEWRRATLRSLDHLWDLVNVLALPTTGALRKEIGRDEIDIAGSPVFYRTLLSQFTAPINRLGLPALALPLQGDTTPPVSIQLIGPAGGEPRLFSAGSLLERLGLVAYGVPEHWYGRQMVGGTTP